MKIQIQVSSGRYQNNDYMATDTDTDAHTYASRL